MGERKIILRNNFMLASKFDSFDVVKREMDITFSSLEKYKLLFNNEEDEAEYGEYVDKIYNIIKAEIKEFFRKYYKDRIDEFE